MVNVGNIYQFHGSYGWMLKIIVSHTRLGTITYPPPANTFELMIFPLSPGGIWTMMISSKSDKYIYEYTSAGFPLAFWYISLPVSGTYLRIDSKKVIVIALIFYHSHSWHHYCLLNLLCRCNCQQKEQNHHNKLPHDHHRHHHHHKSWIIVVLKIVIDSVLWWDDSCLSSKNQDQPSTV